MKTFLHQAWVIARNTFKESVRDRVFYVIFIFAFACIVFTTFLGSISLGEDLPVVRSLGLAGVYLFGLVIAVFLGASLVYKELERRTLYFVLSKPVTRAGLIVGKWAGLCASVAVSVVGMTVIYLGVVAYEGGGFDTAALLVVSFELLELGLVIALTTFFSSFAKPLASLLYTILVVYIGHSLSLLVAVAEKQPGIASVAVKGAYYVVPNLEKFNIRELIAAGMHPTLPMIAIASAYACAYIVLLLVASMLLIRRRDL